MEQIARASKGNGRIARRPFRDCSAKTKAALWAAPCSQHWPKMLGFFVRRRTRTEATSAADAPDRHPGDILPGPHPEPRNQQAVIAEANCAIVAARTRIHRRKSSDEPCIITGPGLV